MVPSQPFVPDAGRLAIVLDPPNLMVSYAKRYRDGLLPFGALLRPFMGGDTPSCWAVACIARKPDSSDALPRLLRARGVEVWERLVNRNAEGSFGKTNCDAELGFALAEAGHRADVVVLFSGDADFAPAVERLVARGKKVHVVSFTEATARGLRTAATSFTPAERLLGLPPRDRATEHQNRYSSLSLERAAA